MPEDAALVTRDMCFTTDEPQLVDLSVGLGERLSCLSAACGGERNGCWAALHAWPCKQVAVSTCISSHHAANG